MPLISVESVSAHTQLGLWKMCGDEERLSPLEFPPVLQGRLSQVSSPKRRMEIASTHALLYAMLGRHDVVIGHEASGKPLLEGYSLSLTHTKGYVAIILSDAEPVAIDMEYRDSRVMRVADRFLRADEQPDGEDACLLHWCAKEAAYKYFSAQNLTFEEMRVLPFVQEPAGRLRVENVRDGVVLSLAYRILADAVLVYSASVSGEV